MHRYWFDSVVPQKVGLALLAALVPWSVLVGVFGYLLGAFEAQETADTASALGTALFFASVNIFTILAGALVVRRSQQLVDELHMSCDDGLRLTLRQRLGAFTTKQFLFILAGSLMAGMAQNMVLQGTVLDVFSAITSSTVAFAGALGALLSWVVISFVVIALVLNARIFAEIGKLHLDIDLLHPENHSLLGRAALMPTLALIGSQILYPLLWIGGEYNFSAVVPGFLVTLAALVYLFLRTTLPLHWRLRQAKEEWVNRINARIERVRLDHPELSTANLVELQALLDHRSYLQACPEWPFKMTTIARWSLYLLIPPLTWVGAALIENVVDVALG